MSGGRKLLSCCHRAVRQAPCRACDSPMAGSSRDVCALAGSSGKADCEMLRLLPEGVEQHAGDSLHDPQEKVHAHAQEAKHCLPS